MSLVDNAKSTESVSNCVFGQAAERDRSRRLNLPVQTVGQRLENIAARAVDSALLGRFTRVFRPLQDGFA